MSALESFLSLKTELETQDNCITRDPIFMVQEEVRVYGVSRDYTNDFETVIDEDDGKKRKVGYVAHYENRQPFFTRKGAEEYLRINGHNLRSPRIYVESAYRNAEWQLARAAIGGDK